MDNYNIYIRKYLNFQRVAGNSKLEIIQEIANIFYKHKSILDRDICVKEMCEREKLGSFNLGFKTAFPHCETENVIDSKILIFKLDKEINWDGQKVNFIISFVSYGEDEIFRKILFSILDLIIDEHKLEKLKTFELENEVYDFLEENNEYSWVWQRIWFEH